MDNHPDNRRDKAIIAIVGKSVSYDSDGDTIIKWHSKDVSQPSEADIDVKVAEYKIEWDALEYARNRKIEYDALNQFELISDDTINGTSTHKDAIEAIKAKYPKP